MGTRDEWEVVLRAALRTADEPSSEANAYDRLARALFTTGVYDVRISRAGLARQAGELEAVQGRVIDGNGEEHAFEACRPPFDRTFRWVMG